jgi:hypothetical protein
MNSQTMSSRAEAAGYYVFLVTTILSPIIFWPSAYIAVDTVKTVVIGLGVIVSAILLGYAAVKESRLVLPPKQILWTSISLIVSALFSVHVGKSLFGQGFESNTVSFIAVLFVAALAAFTLIQKKLERSIILYIGIFASYLVVFIFQALRVIFGSNFASFSIFVTQTSSALGNWFDLGTYSIVIVLISLCAIIFEKVENNLLGINRIICIRCIHRKQSTRLGHCFLGIVGDDYIPIDKIYPSKKL